MFVCVFSIGVGIGMDNLYFGWETFICRCCGVGVGWISGLPSEDTVMAYVCMRTRKKKSREQTMARALTLQACPSAGLEL